MEVDCECEFKGFMSKKGADDCRKRRQKDCAWGLVAGTMTLHELSLSGILAATAHQPVFDLKQALDVPSFLLTSC